MEILIPYFQKERKIPLLKDEKYLNMCIDYTQLVRDTFMSGSFTTPDGEVFTIRQALDFLLKDNPEAYKELENKILEKYSI